MMSCNDKFVALAKISTINAVDGFDPTPLAVDYTDTNGETRKRLPVMAQEAWFRLKYPEGRIAINVTPSQDCFVAVARVYKNYTDPVDCFLSEASASRTCSPDKPTISPREWAQTAAVGIALRRAGFGLQFGAAGEAFDDPAVNELGQPVAPQPASGAEDDTYQADMSTPEQSAEDPLEAAMKMPCPIGKYKSKTLGDMISIDPGALVWVANKFPGDPAISAAARFICEHSLAATA